MAREQKLMLSAKRIKRKGILRSNKMSQKTNCIKYRVGDLVLVKALNVSDTVAKMIAKFMAIYEGPYIIKEQKQDSSFLLSNIDNFSDRGTFNASSLIPYYVKETQPNKGSKLPNNANATTRNDVSTILKPGQSAHSKTPTTPKIEDTKKNKPKGRPRKPRG